MTEATNNAVPVHGMRWFSESLFEVTLPHGDLIANYHPSLGTMIITSYDVAANFRNAGIGKNLLRIANYHAEQLGAKAIWAHLTSRESVDAMTSVFGEKAVTVKHLGLYNQDRLPPHRQTGTDATLEYYLPNSASGDALEASVQ